MHSKKITGGHRKDALRLSVRLLTSRRDGEGVRRKLGKVLRMFAYRKHGFTGLDV